MCLISRIKAKNFLKKENSYNKLRCRGIWKGYQIYEAYNKEMKDAFTGLPHVILVNFKETRWATSDEIYDIMNK